MLFWGYNAILISTIVDVRRLLLASAGGYNAILISTIVDAYAQILSPCYGYNAILISTIVDPCMRGMFSPRAIMLF